ncbi:MAG: hypothetical protein ACI9IP_002267 [Arcticibacterium sp.]|jgi:hypothetical protein
MGIDKSMFLFAFGLNIKSDIDFSDVLLRADREADISISKTVIPKKEFVKTNVFRKGVQAEIHIQDKTVTLHWPGIVSVQITKGQGINYHQLGENLHTLKLFLLSETIGILLAQRGVFLLHGSALQ